MVTAEECFWRQRNKNQKQPPRGVLPKKVFPKKNSQSSRKTLVTEFFLSKITNLEISEDW